MKYGTPEYYRWYRNKNKERIHAQEKLRRLRETPEKRAARLERNKKWRMKQPGYGIGRGHGNHANSLSHMTQEEKKAHRYAMIKRWRENNPEKVAKYGKNRNYAYDYDRWRKYYERNFQKCLERGREKMRRIRDRNRKIEYKPRMNRRLPDWCENPAQARALQSEGFSRMISDEVPFRHAIQSGLTVGRFSA